MNRTSTRLLLTCAALGVAGSLVFVPTVYAGTALLALAPVFYGLATGAYILPGVLAQALFRRGGIAFITTLLAGLVAAPFVPGGITYLPIFALVGAVQELPFAINRYRYWRGWVFYATAVVVGAAAGISSFRLLDVATTPLWVQIVQPLTYVIAFVAFTWIGRAVAAALDRTGVARGLQRSIDRTTESRK